MSTALSNIRMLAILTTLLALRSVVHASNPTASENQIPVEPESVPRPVANAHAASGPIAIDGRLDEPAWEEAEALSDFVQSQPRAGYPATEKTVVRVLYDADNLYIGAILYDSAPDKFVVTTLEKDYESLNSDVFSVALDTFLDRRSCFMFFINPRGAVRDAQGFDDGRDRNLSWDGVIKVRTHTHEQGWNVEMAIPWTTLRFDSRLADQGWGVNFLRRVRRKNEDSYWAPVDRRDSVYTMSRAGTLLGLRGIRGGRDVRLKPYAMVMRSSEALQTAGVNGTTFDGGIDFKYSVTPRLTMDLTYRTDFSQVEVDQEQVNLSRFSLFFPEQRDFFVENSGLFAFGDLSDRKYRMGASLRDFSLFHSRRIGLTDDGQPIPIAGGGRLTGRAGGFEVGLISMQTQATEFMPSENFTIARVRRGLFGASNVGAIVTNRQGSGLGHNRSYGVDANLRPHPAMLINSYFAKTDYPAAESDNTAARVSVAWRDRLWNVSSMIKRVGEAFDPGVGFVRRVGLRQVYTTVGVHARPNLPAIQEINPYAETDYVADEGWVPETRSRAAGIATEFHDGGVVSAVYTDQYERLTEPFRVSGGGLVPIGEYQFGEGSLGYRSSAGRALSGSVTVARGGFYNGTRNSLSLRGTWRPSYRFSTDLSVSRNAVRIPGTPVDANVFVIRVHYAHSTTLSGSAFVQYNKVSEQVVMNYRLNLIHAPLSDVFIVYRERRRGDLEGPAERAFILKVTRMLPF